MERASPLSGYYRLAELMSRSQDTAIFRRFRLMNLMNLLGLQAELVDLQRQLKDLYTDAELQLSFDEEEKEFAVNFRKLLASGHSRHLTLLKKTREILKEYSTKIKFAV